MGVALLLIGAVVSGYSAHGEQGFVALGSPERLAGRTISVVDVTQPSLPVTRATLGMGQARGVVEIEENSSFNTELRRAWIERRWWGDVYVTPLALLAKPTDFGGRPVPAGAMLEVTTKPGIPLVWVGIALTALGLAMALGRRLRELRAT